MEHFNTNQITSQKDLLSLLESKGTHILSSVLIEQACIFLEHCYQDIRRKSGNLHITHNFTVAGFLVQLQLDEPSIIAGLLHDVVDNNHTTIEEIDRQFGTEVAYLVNGLSTIKDFTKKHQETQDNENFTELIFHASDDVRIVIIRLADRLHNILDIGSMNTEFKMETARRVLNMYAPLAEFLGLGILQRIMEDTAFAILHPEKFSQIQHAIDTYYSTKEDTILAFEKEFRNILSGYTIGFQSLKARRKGVYSVYNKIKRKKGLEAKDADIHKNMDSVKDLYAARVIVTTIEDCYVVLGLLNAHYGTLPEEFEDYIAKPKPNGYQSIHTLFDFRGVTLEVQIRTQEMHDYAEYGPASHIVYKRSGGTDKSDVYTWTKDTVNWDVREGDDRYKIKVLQDSIFCFTPKGKVIALPAGASPIDFAFRIHTEVGLHYRGALVNGKMVSMDYELSTGDTVEIIMTSKINVRANWIGFAQSRSTRSSIRKALREVDR